MFLKDKKSKLFIRILCIMTISNITGVSVNGTPSFFGNDALLKTSKFHVGRITKDDKNENKNNNCFILIFQ